MRFVTIICLFILFHRSIILGDFQCRCECCLTDGCRPIPVGYHPLWFCSEQLSCTQSKCVEWHADRCPTPNSFGQTRAICLLSKARKLKGTSSIFISSFIFFLNGFYFFVNRL